MRIAMAASEAEPFVKTGGLGDVVGALGPALARRGHEVFVFLPGHLPVRNAAMPDAPRVPLPDFGAELLPLPSPHPGCRFYAIDAPHRFARANPYGDEFGRDWPDNNSRYAWFCRAVLAAADRVAPHTEILHAHDWPTGLLPVYAREARHSAARVFTIHNLAYQGLFPFEQFGELALPDHWRSMDNLEFHGRFSHLKGGIVAADLVTTVSPRYAREILAPEFGCGLDGLLRHRADALRGTLNGIDEAAWNPATDPALPAPFDPGNWAVQRPKNRTALAAELGLAEPDRPLVGMIGRLAWQKGFDLLAACADELARSGANLALLATPGAAEDEATLREAAARHPGAVAVRFALDDGLARRLYAAADLLVVPSRFEPCGLTQFYAMRYGAIPVVHAVGGLADTVVDAGPATLADGAASGFVFRSPTAEALRGALRRALRALANGQTRDRLVAANFARDWSWNRTAAGYEEIYAEAAALPR